MTRTVFKSEGNGVNVEAFRTNGQLNILLDGKVLKCTPEDAYKLRRIIYAYEYGKDLPVFKRRYHVTIERVTLIEIEVDATDPATAEVAVEDNSYATVGYGGDGNVVHSDADFHSIIKVKEA